MAVFLAAADESASANGTGEFYFGGFVAPERDWSEYFAPAWRERILDRIPRLESFHVADLKSDRWRRNNGISEEQAEQKIDEAFSVINAQGSLYPITAQLNADHFRAATSGANVQMLVRTPGGVARVRFDPDYLCFLRFALHALHYVRETCPEAERVDFLVERNGSITRHIGRYHESIPKVLVALGRPDLAALVGELIPGGKDRVPLQAADLMCWYARNAEILTPRDSRRFLQVAKRPGMKSRASEQEIEDIVARMKTAGLTADDVDAEGGIVSAS